MGIQWVYSEPKDDAEYEGLISGYADSGDCDLIICLGGSQSSSLENVAPNYPQQKFVILDAVVQGDNIRSYTWRDQELGFLAGFLGASLSDTNTLGFIGAHDIPLCNLGAAGMIAGAHYANPDCQVLVDYANGWAEVNGCYELATSMHEQGASLLYHTASAGGLGILNAGKEKNFLTVFSGPPGSGKTSICSILAHVLGLDLVSEALGRQSPESLALWPSPEFADRYLPISVERGWTSKRDFVGYWNPLTKTFESVDDRRRDAFQALDAEARLGAPKLPAVMLLDEANLSPMEYYWADFMNVCDDASGHASISLGDHRRLKISPALRFLATINNDHTTETLSPRLVDRAAVITLPAADPAALIRTARSFTPQIISWAELSSLFSAGTTPLTGAAGEGLEELISLTAAAGTPMSIRVQLAFEKAVLGGLPVFREDPKLEQSAADAALDCAAASRLLPHLSGNGPDYRSALVNLLDAAHRRRLVRTAGLLETMISRGDRALGYFSFL